MLVVISPAKRLDWSERPGAALSTPEFLTEANRLVKTARELDAGDLSRMMGISDDLARLNVARFKAYRQRGGADRLRPAVYAFAGDTYLGLEAATLEADALRWAEGHLRILSGLYGLLRPMDGIQEYRLEMGSRMANPRGPNLYAFWGPRIARALGRAAKAAETDLLVNCASNEYFEAVDQKALKLRVITPVFLEEKDGDAKIVSFFAKRARGAMARFICERQVTDMDGLREFDLGGYGFDPARSEGDRLVFTRAYAPEASKLAS